MVVVHKENHRHHQFLRQKGGTCPPVHANDIGNAWGGFVSGDNTPGWAQYYRGVGGAGARNNGSTNVPTGR